MKKYITKKTITIAVIAIVLIGSIVSNYLLWKKVNLEETAINHIGNAVLTQNAAWQTLSSTWTEEQQQAFSTAVNTLLSNGK